MQHYSRLTVPLSKQKYNYGQNGQKKIDQLLVDYMRWTENPPWLGRIKCHNQQHQHTLQVHFYKFFFLFFCRKAECWSNTFTNHNNIKKCLSVFFSLSLSLVTQLFTVSLILLFSVLNSSLSFFFLPQVKFCFFFNVLKNFFPFLYFNLFFFYTTVCLN